jgi:hypothetical protein
VNAEESEKDEKDEELERDRKKERDLFEAKKTMKMKIDRE